MFDGRTENLGYSPVTPYIVVSGAWEEHTSTIVCSHTGDEAEFILYVRKTVGLDHLVVDDVNIDWSTTVPENAHAEVRVFPNPATEVVNIQLGMGATEQASFALTDALGNTVRAGKLNNAATIQVGELPRGIYFVRVLQGDAVRVSRFTKH